MPTTTVAQSPMETRESLRIFYTFIYLIVRSAALGASAVSAFVLLPMVMLSALRKPVVVATGIAVGPGVASFAITGCLEIRGGPDEGGRCHEARC